MSIVFQPIRNTPGYLTSRAVQRPPLAHNSALAVQMDRSSLANPPGFGGYYYPVQAKGPHFKAHHTQWDFHQGDIYIGSHPPGNPEMEHLDRYRKKAFEIVTKPRPGFPNGWLDPQDTVFKMADEDEMRRAIARDGFLSRFPHYYWGERYNVSYQQSKLGIPGPYEVVTNTYPAKAFMLDTNKVFQQKVVFPHVYGHTHFFNHNFAYSQTDRNIEHYMGETKRLVQKLENDPIVMHRATLSDNPVEKFIDNYLSIKYLIDLDKLAPPPLNLSRKDVANDLQGLPADIRNVGPNMKELGFSQLYEPYILSDAERQKEIDRRIGQIEESRTKIPLHPTRDVLGFLVEHSKALKPWQKELLERLRYESYYFAPQMRDAAWNEGFATFIHNKVESDPEYMELDYNLDQIFHQAGMMANVETPGDTSSNPYHLGYEIFKNIYEQAGRGLPPYMSDEELSKQYNYNDLMRIKRQPIDDEKGMKAVLEAAANEDDPSGIQKYLTPELVKKLKLYQHGTTQNWQGQAVTVITSRDYEKVKTEVINQFRHSGLPDLEVIDGNFEGNGQLLLRHVQYDTEMNREDTQKTLKVVYGMWGQPVHLDSNAIFDNPEYAELLHKIVLKKEAMADPSLQNSKVNATSLEEMERQLKTIPAKKYVPIRFTTTDGKATEIYELKDGKTKGKFDPSKYQVKQKNPFE